MGVSLRSSYRLGRAIHVVLAGGAMLLGVGAATAATITVDSAADANPSNTTDGSCTLREAISATETNTAIDNCLAGSASVIDTIEFAASLVGSTITVVDQLEFSTSQTSIVSGDIDNDGSGDITLGGGGDERILDVCCAANVTLRYLSISDGHDNVGGAIHNAATATLALEQVDLRDSYAQNFGGGISNAGILNVKQSTLSGNQSEFYGGGISNSGTLVISQSTLIGNHTQRRGGGVYNTASGNLTISKSTLSDNSAQFGGGILNAGIGPYSHGTLTIRQSTVSGNSAQVGAGIYNHGNLTVYQSTLSGNSASGDGGGGGVYNGSIVPTYTQTLVNSIVADNGGGNCAGPGPFDATSSGNLFWPALDNCDGGTVGNPQLGPLADNGGPTRTLVPGAQSMAIDMVACASGVTEDQRGMPRPQIVVPGPEPWCDIGAVEVNANDLERIFSNGFD